jgi:hypothetical protein
MEEFFKELAQIYKSRVRIKQLKRKTIENFSRFYVSFVDQNNGELHKKDKDGKKKKDKYLQLKNLGLRYILDNQDLIYSEINK